MTESNPVVTWCSTNISPKAYYLADRSGGRIGGVGWEIAGINHAKPTIAMNDKQMLVLFLLKFSHTGITVATHCAANFAEQTMS